MADKNYTLSHISELKGCTVEELCQFAQEKGIELPVDPDYSVSASKLNAIDPQLAFNIKYGKIVSVKKDNQADSSEEKLSIIPPEVYHLPKEKEAKPKVNVLGKIDLSTLNQSSRPKKKEKEDKVDGDETNNKPNTPQRIIGIIKFFDINKGWGFVISGNKGISGKAEDEGKIFSLHITSTEWRGMLSPKDNEWIILTPRKNIRGWSATKAERLDCNRENLLFAMRYRGKYAKIYGSDSKGDHYDENILCHIIKEMTCTSSAANISASYNISKFTIIIDTFCEYIAERPQKRQSIIIDQFLEDKELHELLLKIFIEGDYTTENPLRQTAYMLYRRKLLDQLFVSGTMSDLSKLPESFDFTLYIDKLTNILIKEASLNSGGDVENWLSTHPIYDKLVLDNAATQTIPLRLILKKLTGKDFWIKDISADWPEIKEFIKENPDRAYSY